MSRGSGFRVCRAGCASHIRGTLRYQFVRIHVHTYSEFGGYVTDKAEGVTENTDEMCNLVIELQFPSVRSKLCVFSEGGSGSSDEAKDEFLDLAIAEGLLPEWGILLSQGGQEKTHNTSGS